MNKYNFQEAYLDESCFYKSSNLFQEIDFPAWLQEQKALGKVQTLEYPSKYYLWYARMKQRLIHALQACKTWVHFDGIYRKPSKTEVIFAKIRLRLFENPVYSALKNKT